MAWVILFVAGLLEVAWALLLKQSEGFTRPPQTIGFIASLFLSMFLLSQALKTLPVGPPMRSGLASVLRERRSSG